MNFCSCLFSSSTFLSIDFCLAINFIAELLISQIHDSKPLSVRSLKALSDKLISDQHFTSRDFSDAVYLYLFWHLIILNFSEWSSINICFLLYLQELVFLEVLDTASFLLILLTENMHIYYVVSCLKLQLRFGFQYIYVILQVMGYDIGTSKIAFLFLEDLFIQLRFFSIFIFQFFFKVMTCVIIFYFQ